MGNFFSGSSTEKTVEEISLIQETISFNQEFGIKDESIITRIRVIAKPETFALELDFDNNTDKRDGTRIEYKKDKSGCLVEWWQDQTFQKKLLLGADYAETFCDNFYNILKAQKSTLEVFEIDFQPGKLHTVEQESNYELIISQFLARVENVLEVNFRTKRPLKVKFFIMKQLEKNQFLKILKWIDAKQIQKISISDSKERYQMLDVELFVKLEQWKNAAGVELMYYDMTIPTQHFWGFGEVKLTVKSVSTEAFRNLKEAFETAMHMKYFEIKYKTFIVDSFLGVSRPPAARRLSSDYQEIATVDHLVFLFGQPSISSTQDEKKWIFTIQDTDEKYEVKLRPSYIIFERIAVIAKEEDNGFFAGIRKYFWN